MAKKIVFHGLQQQQHSMNNLGQGLLGLLEILVNIRVVVVFLLAVAVDLVCGLLLQNGAVALQDAPLFGREMLIFFEAEGLSACCHRLCCCSCFLLLADLLLHLGQKGNGGGLQGRHRGSEKGRSIEPNPEISSFSQVDLSRSMQQLASLLVCCHLDLSLLERERSLKFFCLIRLAQQAARQGHIDILQRLFQAGLAMHHLPRLVYHSLGASRPFPAAIYLRHRQIQLMLAYRWWFVSSWMHRYNACRGKHCQMHRIHAHGEDFRRITFKMAIRNPDLLGSTAAFQTPDFTMVILASPWPASHTEHLFSAFAPLRALLQILTGLAWLEDQTRMIGRAISVVIKSAAGRQQKRKCRSICK